MFAHGNTKIDARKYLYVAQYYNSETNGYRLVLIRAYSHFRAEKIAQAQRDYPGYALRDVSFIDGQEKLERSEIDALELFFS